MRRTYTKPLEKNRNIEWNIANTTDPQYSGHPRGEWVGRGVEVEM